MRAAWCAVFVCVSAHAQADSAPLQRVLAQDAAQLVQHADPVVRGEAALILAAGQQAKHHAAVLAVAHDRDPEAQLRGILALGLQGTPGVATILADLLEDPAVRTRPAGVAAALALGSLPPDHAPNLTTQVLTGVLQSSLKRHREMLLALLLGLRQHAQPAQASALRQLFDDDSLRDAEVRARLLLLLLPIEHALDGIRLDKLLERGSDEERVALLHWLASNPSAVDAELLPIAERLARHADKAVLRAAALAMLTGRRHLPALEIAAKALESAHGLEAAQGMRSALAIGGASLRLALDGHLRDERDPARKEALLRAYGAPPSPALAADCQKLASDRGQPQSLRIAAATVLSRSDPVRAAPLLRELFRDASGPQALGDLATALLAEGQERPPLDRLLHGPAELRLHGDRWRPLLAAGHPEAIRQLLQLVQDKDARPADLAVALRAYRQCTVLDLPAADAELLPASLRALFVE